MLGSMWGSCDVVMAKQCNVAAVAQAHAARLPATDTEREAELPLLSHGSHVTELGSEAVDAERCAPPGSGGQQCEFQALATAPVELVATLPAQHQPGQAIVMHGPHGPVHVVPPSGVEPGARVRFRLAPSPEFRITVPPDCGPGSVIRFERSDGVEVSVAVPPQLRPGETFEVTPPSMMVKVPEGAMPGDLVLFRHSLGKGPSGREAVEWCRAEVPKSGKPGSYFTARLPRPERKPGDDREREAERAPAARAFAREAERERGGGGGRELLGASCMSLKGFLADTSAEEI